LDPSCHPYQRNSRDLDDPECGWGDPFCNFWKRQSKTTTYRPPTLYRNTVCGFGDPFCKFWENQTARNYVKEEKPITFIRMTACNNPVDPLCNNRVPASSNRYQYFSHNRSPICDMNVDPLCERYIHSQIGSQLQSKITPCTHPWCQRKLSPFVSEIQKVSSTKIPQECEKEDCDKQFCKQYFPEGFPECGIVSRLAAPDRCDGDLSNKPWCQDDFTSHSRTAPCTHLWCRHEPPPFIADTKNVFLARMPLECKGRNDLPWCRKSYRIPHSRRTPVPPPCTGDRINEPWCYPPRAESRITLSRQEIEPPCLLPFGFNKPWCIPKFAGSHSRLTPTCDPDDPECKWFTPRSTRQFDDKNKIIFQNRVVRMGPICKGTYCPHTEITG
jgi:hypothetical protein